MTPHPETIADSRRMVYGLLITLAAGLTLGRLASVERLHEPSVHRGEGDGRPRPAWPSKRPNPWPTFSSNDRSRWATVRALVDEGTFVVGRRDPVMLQNSVRALIGAGDPLQTAVMAEVGFRFRVGSDQGIIFEDGFQSVDKILHPATLEFYSTKPPLLSVIAAGGYWLLKQAFGWDFVEDRFLVIPVLLVTLNLLPFLLYLWLLTRLAERISDCEWSCYYVVGAAGFATLMTPFLISFNNHTIAATAVLIAVYAVARIREGGGAGWYVLAGLTSGFAPCNDLPSLALLAGLGTYLLWFAPGRTLLLFLPSALLAPAAALGLNYVALGQWTPAYAQFGTTWYQYEGSHWLVPEGVRKAGIDFVGRNGETKDVYAFHLLIGHHGWFSLMPIMLLTLPGMLLALRKGEGKLSARLANHSRLLGESGVDEGLTSFARREIASPIGPIALLTFLVSTVVIAFYLVRSDNYGGWSNGPRWLTWLTPLWLLSMLPTLDVLARHKLARGFALVLLALSISSMSYQFWNPWRHPWIYNWMEARGWLGSNYF